jgi:DNA-binding response OmpR family regulator
LTDGLRVLVAQERSDERATLCANLERWGHWVFAVDSAEAAVFILETVEIDLALLAADQLAEPALLAACRSLRGARPALFVLLNSWTADLDWSARSDFCVDDCLLRPVCPAELKLRLQLRLGMSRRPDGDRERDAPFPPGPRGRLRGRFAHGPLQVDFDRYFVHVDGREIPLSAREMEVLRYFCQSPGYLRSREELLTSVWGYQPGVTSRTVDVCIKRLRRKLGAAGQLIETVRGVGYRFGGRETGL